MYMGRRMAFALVVSCMGQVHGCHPALGLSRVERVHDCHPSAHSALGSCMVVALAIFCMEQVVGTHLGGILYGETHGTACCRADAWVRSMAMTLPRRK